MSKVLDIDGGNIPTIGKRVLYFVADDEGGVQTWPARILDNYADARRDPKTGQLLCLLKIETRDGDIVADVHQEPSRQAGSFDFYKDADLRV